MFVNIYHGLVNKDYRQCIQSITWMNLTDYNQLKVPIAQLYIVHGDDTNTS